MGKIPSLTSIEVQIATGQRDFNKAIEILIKGKKENQLFPGEFSPKEFKDIADNLTSASSIFRILLLSFEDLKNEFIKMGVKPNSLKSEWLDQLALEYKKAHK